MNRQPNGPDSNSNSIPSSLKKKTIEEPCSLKADTLLQASFASLESSEASSNLCDTQVSLDQSSSSVSQTNQTENERQARQRMAMTEQYLLKALQLDQR
jgi:hypothetical protein